MFNFGPKVPTITVEEVKKAIDEQQHFLLLDVRTPEEYARGKIKNSINLPVDKISAKIEQLIPNKKQTIYVYCLSGSRSNLAVATMAKLSYQNVFSMISGLLAWRAKQYPILD